MRFNRGLIEGLLVQLPVSAVGGGGGRVSVGESKEKEVKK